MRAGLVFIAQAFCAIVVVVFCLERLSRRWLAEPYERREVFRAYRRDIRGLRRLTGRLVRYVNRHS